MSSPAINAISFGVMVLVGVTAGVLVLVNAKRVHAWAEKRSPAFMLKPSLAGVRFVGGVWLFGGLFCIGGVVYWASQI